MKTIAFVSCESHPGLWIDDELVLPFISGHFNLEVHPWDEPGVDWTAYDAVIIRGAWDYHQKLPAFIEWLDYCSAAGVRLYNPAELVRWNLDKHYLLDMAGKGVLIPDTEWLEPGGIVDIPAILSAKNWDKAVIKPAISLGAYKTWVTTPDSAEADSVEAQTITDGGEALLVQPFLPEILEEGEWSLLYFNGTYSHSLLKRPKDGDFRVQHIHGGSMNVAAAPDWLIEQGRQIVAALPHPPLYARVDGVRRDEQFLLMELELIEPVLYLAQGANAPEHWGRAIVELLK